MDSNDPGTSLFQGNELSNFNNFEQREEEEALEEQRRRDLELKNELENAFYDVSFENDEESVCNGHENRSKSSSQSSRQSSLSHEVNSCFFKGSIQNISITDNNLPGVPAGNFNTPLNQSLKRNSVQKVDCGNDREKLSKDCGKKIINGNLHDIVDQSGGGEQNLQSLMHYNHCFQKSPLGEGICNVLPNNHANNIVMPNYTDQAEESSEQLKILYDIRVREVHRLTQLIDSMRNEHEIKISDLKHQLALMAAEKERANISHSQLQSLLVDCKQQVEQLVNDVNALEKAKKELETSNKELLIEFETAKLTVDDLQRKILVFEKGNRSKSEAEQYELKIKYLTEKHNAELMSMKKELDSYMRNYETVLKENEQLKLKIINLSQINDENLTKKSEIISRLSQQIEETQKKCESLMKLSTAEDNYLLQAELKILKEEKLQLMCKIEGLEKEKAKQDEELQQYESLNKICFFNSNWSNLKDFEGSEISGKLGTELYRALSSQKAKRQEINSLQTQLSEKNKQMLLLIENEKTLNKEIEKVKEEMQTNLSKLKEKESLILQKEEEITKLQASFKELQEKIITYQSESLNKCQQLEEENKLLKVRVNALGTDKVEIMSNYNEEYLRFHNEGLEKMREETEKHFKLEILQKDLEIENLKKEIEELKILYVEVCSAKENLISQIEKEKNNSVCSNSVDLEEVKRLQKELERSRQRILELDHTLKQQYEQEVEVLNSDLNEHKLQLERLRKEKDREISEKDKILAENKLLKSEIDQVSSEKNLLFLDYEKLLKEADGLRNQIEKVKENSKAELKKIVEEHSLALQNLSNKYEITIIKLKKEIELSVKEVVKYESKYTSPIKNCMKSVGTQECPLVLVDKCTSPISKLLMLENKLAAATSKEPSGLLKDISILTDPEPVKIPKKDVIEIMEKLGAHHEQEIVTLEKKYAAERLKLEKKFHMEIDRAREMIEQDLNKKHQMELEQLKQKHRIEMENRIEQEKNEVVVELITEWAREVQSLKVSYAEAQAEMEKMKLKCKAAKNMVHQYKAYFKNKTDHMKEEWKKIEDGYVQALKDLEQNVNVFVSSKEDLFQVKVDSLTHLYEQRIIQMKEKLLKCEKKLKAEKNSESKKLENLSSREKLGFKKELESLSTPDWNLRQKLSLPQKNNPEEVLSECRKILKAKLEEEESDVCLKLDSCGKSRTPRKKHLLRPRVQTKKDKTDR